MLDDKQKNLEEKMRLLKAHYLTQLQTQKETLTKFIEQYEQNNFDQKSYAELKILAHKLTGTGTTYGYPRISTAGRALDLLTDSQLKLRDLLEPMQDLLSACETALSEKIAEDIFNTVTENNVLTIAENNQPILLVVDDDPSIQEMASTLLNAYAQVNLASDINTALQIIKNQTPDLVLLDHILPNSESGLALLTQLQSDSTLKTIPIIMLTASDQPENVLQGLTQGAIDYIIKPFEPEPFIEKINSYLKKARASILIADDDESVRRLLAHKFQNAGYHVEMAENGIEALEKMRKHPPQLALLDRMMPGYDGLTVMQKMKEIDLLADIPVIFLTAKKQENDVLEGLNLGAADYIVKPFSPYEVLARCDKWLTTYPHG